VGAFCNGEALLMGCKTAEGVHVALLSLFHLDECGIDEVKIASVSWLRNGAGAAEAYTLLTGEARTNERFELDESLFVLRKYSPYGDEAALLAAVLDAVRSPTGTMQELFHLHTTGPDGETLLRFDVPGDVMLRPGASKTHTNQPAESSPPALDTSLRAYLEVLYLTPRLRITLRGVPVEHRCVASGLYHLEDAAPYAPRGTGISVIMKLGVAVETNCEEAAGPSSDVADARLSRCAGVSLYWQGRLIRYCEPLGLQRGNNGLMGAGVCGVCDVGELLTPLPTKQAFELGGHHLRLLKELGDRLNSYTNRLLTEGVIDPDMQRRRLTDAAAGAFAAVRAKDVLDAALAADSRRKLSCVDCFKHRFLSNDVDDATFEALDSEVWRCSMHPDAVVAAAGCGAAQEAPQAPEADSGFLPQTEMPLPDWLKDYGILGWRYVRVPRAGHGRDGTFNYYFFSPAGTAFWTNSRPKVEAFIRAGGDNAARRLTDAAPAPAKKKKRGRSARPAKAARKEAASSDDGDEYEEEAEEEPPMKRRRGRSAIAELAVVQKEKAKANRELAAQERALQQKQQKLDAAEAAFERKRQADLKRRQAEARRSARHAEPEVDDLGAVARPLRAARGERLCRCQRTLAECAGQLTVSCDECGADFHAECLGLAHDVAACMDIACADHAEAAVEARKAAALLMPHPRAARRGAGGRADPAPSPSVSMFELFPGADGAAGEDEAVSRSSGLPANWPKSTGAPAFLTHNVHGEWPSPEAWALLHATHDQSPLPGVSIRTLPLSHKLAKVAIGAKGSKPRGASALSQSLLSFLTPSPSRLQDCSRRAASPLAPSLASTWATCGTPPAWTAARITCSSSAASSRRTAARCSSTRGRAATRRASSTGIAAWRPRPTASSRRRACCAAPPPALSSSCAWLPSAASCAMRSCSSTTAACTACLARRRTRAWATTRTTVDGC